MGYFLIVPEQNAVGAGNTVSAENTYTSDTFAVATTCVATCAPTVMWSPGAEAVATSTVDIVDMGVWSDRECFSIMTSAICEIADVAGGSAIEVYDEVTQLTSTLTRLTFIGSDVVAQSGAGTGYINVYVPPLTWSPTLNVTVNGGPYNGAATVEIGATIPGISIAWATNDLVNFPITAYSALTVNGGAIVLDGGASVATGGLYTAALDVVSLGTGVSVQVSSTTFNQTLTDNIAFISRVYWGKSPITAAITEAQVEGLVNGQLQASKNATRSMAATGVPEYSWICWPVTYGAQNTATGFVNPANSFAVPMQAAETVNITNAEGYSQNYLCYRSTNASASAFDIRVA